MLSNKFISGLIFDGLICLEMSSTAIEMMVIPETRRVHKVLYLRFYSVFSLASLHIYCQLDRRPEGTSRGNPGN
jgi:hypothetical protein